MDANEELDIGEGYELVAELGHGACGVAKLCREQSSGELVAIKYIKRGEWVDRNVEREILNHRLLSGHTNLVQFKRVFLTSTHLGIAMEYASGGMLFDRIVQVSRFNEGIARYFFQQLVCGVAWCHHKGVCHRDLKLENTLLDGRRAPRLKICDFGYSKSSDTDSMPNTMVGTPAYVAPEVLSQEEYDGEVADVWSCGVALYVMLVGSYPFQDPADPASCPRTVRRILAVQYSIPPDLQLSPDCLDLIRRIFVADPTARITLAQIRQHPWYLANLPRECQNDGELLQQAPPTQTEAEVLAILEEARRAAPGDTGPQHSDEQQQQQQRYSQGAAAVAAAGSGDADDFDEEDARGQFELVGLEEDGRDLD